MRKVKMGFTLIELLVAISIIALIAGIILVSLQTSREKARIAKVLQFSQGVYHLLGVDAVGVWNLNENPATHTTPILDSSGNGNNGTLTTNDGSTNKAVSGVVGGAIQFDGVNDYVNCGNGASLKNMGSAVTVEAWVKYNAYGGGGQAYSVIAVKGNPWTFLMENPNQRIRFRVTAGGVDANAQDSTTHELNRWYHFVGTYDGQNIRIYKDGVRVGITPRTGALAVNNATAKIGTYTGTSYNFNGVIDEVRIYNRALSSAEIQKHYAKGVKKLNLAKNSQ